MNRMDMAVCVARAEGVMMALYGLCRDLVIGSSVDEDKDGFLGSCVVDTVNGLAKVYAELGTLRMPEFGKGFTGEVEDEREEYRGTVRERERQYPDHQ